MSAGVGVVGAWGGARICRFCLCRGDGGAVLCDMFDRGAGGPKCGVPLSLQVMACHNMKISPADGMPSTICSMCRHFMVQSYRFKHICRQGEEALRHYLVHGELKAPVPWPSDMIKTVPKDVLSTTPNVHIVDVQSLEGEEVEIEVPFDMSTIEKIQAGGKHKTTKKSRSKEEDAPMSITSANFKVEEGDDESETTVEISTVDQVEFPSEGGEVKGAYPCSECYHSFPLQQLLELHMKNHKRKRGYKCPLCDKSFFTKYDVRHHISVHTGNKPFDCVICQKKFSRQSLLKRHEKVHRTATRFSCSHCDNTFLTKGSLQTHMQLRHSLDRPFKCPLCDKCFAFKQGLERHSNVHSTRQPHKCNYCSEVFSALNLLKMHVFQKHAGNRPYLCKYCPKTFLLPHHYTRHLKTKHVGEVADTQSPPTAAPAPDAGQVKGQDKDHFKCIQCDIIFDKEDDLIFHSAIHATQDLTCPLCKEIFEDVDEVVVHIKSHIECEQYACEWCELVFNSEYKLDEHIDTEHREMISDALEGTIVYKTVIDENGEETIVVEQMGKREPEDEPPDEEEDGEEEEEEEEEDEAEGEVEQDAATVEQQAVIIGDTQWTPVMSSGSNAVQSGDLQELMLVGGGETIVYQLGSPHHDATISTVVPEATATVVPATSPNVPASVSAESPRPVYTELKTVNHPLYSRTDLGTEAIELPNQTAPTKLSQVNVESNKPPSPQKQAKVATGKVSILQKAEEVMLQKKKLEELKMKARQQMLAAGGVTLKKNMAEEDVAVRSEDLSEAATPGKRSHGEGSADAAAATPEKCAKRVQNKVKILEDVEITMMLPKMVQKPIVRKVLSAESPVKSVSNVTSETEKSPLPPAAPATPRSGEKSLMMLERDIMELKKNAVQKTASTPPVDRATRFFSTKASRASVNSGKLQPPHRRMNSPNKKASLQNDFPIGDRSKTVSGAPPRISSSSQLLPFPVPVKTARSHLLQFPIPVKPLQETSPPPTDTKPQSKKDIVISKRRDDAEKTPAVTVAAPSDGSGASSPRRSRRASKIKDYAAMIKDSAGIESEEDGDSVQSKERTQKKEAEFRVEEARGTEESEEEDDDIDVNEEVLIHRATPAPKSRGKVPGKKRGRPPKFPAVQPLVAVVSTAKRKRKEEVVAPSSSASVSTPQQSPADVTPQKRPRGRPKKTSKTEEKEVDTSSEKDASEQVTPTSTPSHVSFMQKLGGTPSEGSGAVMVSPGGQTLKKVPAQLIKSLPPGVKPLPLPSSMTLGSPVGEVSQMKIGPKTVRVQKFLMPKAQLQAMTEKGLVEMKDGAIVLKQRVKLATNPPSAPTQLSSATSKDSVASASSEVVEKDISSVASEQKGQ